MRYGYIALVLSAMTLLISPIDGRRCGTKTLILLMLIALQIGISASLTFDYFCSGVISTYMKDELWTIGIYAGFAITMTVFCFTFFCLSSKNLFTICICNLSMALQIPLFYTLFIGGVA